MAPRGFPVAQISDGEALSKMTVEATMALSAIRVAGSRPAGIDLLVKEFGLTRERATRAVPADVALVGNGTSRTSVVGDLSGLSVGPRAARRLGSWIDVVQARRPPKVKNLTVGRVMRQSVDSTDSQLLELIRRVAAVDDRPTALAVAALVAGQLGTSSASHLIGCLARALNQKYAQNGSMDENIDRGKDRIAGLVYALSSYGPKGLDLVSQNWSGAGPAFRAAVAPWLLPCLDDSDNAAAAELLDSMVALQLTCVGGDEISPLAYLDDSERLDRVTSRAVELRNGLTLDVSRPIWFSSSDDADQVLLVEDSKYIYSWIGSYGVGHLVCMDPESFQIYGLAEPGVMAAAERAIAWFVDVAGNLRKPGPPGAGYVGKGSMGGASRRYRPGAQFEAAREQARTQLRVSGTAHFRRGHLRLLPPEQKPSDEARDRASARLGKVMTAQHTFVRPTNTQAVPEQEAVNRLGQASFLAAVLGAQDRAAERAQVEA